ncbi:MAG: hypothetical protein Q9227_003010 [Pyrenula ochraceoflavens]
MAYLAHLQGPVRVRREPSDEGDESLDTSEVYSSDIEDLKDESVSLNKDVQQAGFRSETEETSDDTEDEQSSIHNVQTAFDDVTFGALARAQDSINLGKRKRESDHGHKNTHLEGTFRTQLREIVQRKRTTDPQTKRPSHRSSKHAPLVQSSKKPVSRTLSVFTEPSKPRSRDPRFDPAVMSSTHPATSHANKAYSFLNDYRASELAALKAQVRKTKDPSARAQLSKEIMSLESKSRAAQAKSQADEIRRNHRQKEQEMIREGKKTKPYYLKDSDVKRQVQAKQAEGMGAKQREKRERKRRKKEAGRMMKSMPGRRRENVV